MTKNIKQPSEADINFLQRCGSASLAMHSNVYYSLVKSWLCEQKWAYVHGYLRHQKRSNWQRSPEEKSYGSR